MFVLLQPTSPLRPQKSLDNALNKFLDNGYDSMLSLSPSNNFFWNIKKIGITAEYDYLNRKRRQDINDDEKKYFEN